MDPSRFALVMPVHNASQHLPLVLSHLALGPQWEIILVDDGSTDGSGELAKELLPSATLLRRDHARGPAQARNFGVDQTVANVVVFLDSDVIASSETIQELATFLVERPEFAAVFGAYDQTPYHPTPVSRFRNLLHHYVHCSSRGPIPSFWSGFGAVKRDAFLEVGGFDCARYPLPSVEDIDLGTRLWKAGHRPFLEPSLQATHLKAWTLSSFVNTDVFQRARPWTRMILEGHAVKDTLNLNGRFRWPVLLLALTVLFTLLGFWESKLAGFALGFAVTYLALNFHLYQFMSKFGLGLWSIPLLAIHHGCAITGAGLAVLEHASNRIKSVFTSG